MKPILLAAILALPLPLAAQTVGSVFGPPTAHGFINGAKLQELCTAGTADNPVASTFVCAGYITGVVATAQAQIDLALDEQAAQLGAHRIARRGRDSDIAVRRRRRSCGPPRRSVTPGAGLISIALAPCVQFLPPTAVAC